MLEICCRSALLVISIIRFRRQMKTTLWQANWWNNEVWLEVQMETMAHSSIRKSFLIIITETTILETRFKISFEWMNFVNALPNFVDLVINKRKSCQVREKESTMFFHWLIHSKRRFFVFEDVFCHCRYLYVFKESNEAKIIERSLVQNAFSLLTARFVRPFLILWWIAVDFVVRSMDAEGQPRWAMTSVQFLASTYFLHVRVVFQGSFHKFHCCFVRNVSILNCLSLNNSLKENFRRTTKKSRKNKKFYQRITSFVIPSMLRTRHLNNFCFQIIRYWIVWMRFLITFN